MWELLRKRKISTAFPVQTDTQWNTLLRAKNIRRYIESLAVWCFFSTPCLIPRARRHLVLELEGTLLHSTLSGTRRNISYDFRVQYRENGHTQTHYVALRPFLNDFLEEAAAWYNIYLYTTAEKKHADAIADALEGGRRIFRRRFYRQDCDYLDNRFIKKTSKISDDPSGVVFLDAEDFSCMNRLPIFRYFGCPNDLYLISTLALLDSLRHCNDVRSILGLGCLSQ